MRFLARRLLLALGLLALLAAIFYFEILPRTPGTSARGPHGGQIAGQVAAVAMTVARVALAVVELAALTTIAVGLVCVGGHLLGRYVRRPGHCRLPGTLGRFVESQRAVRAPVTVEVVLGRDDRASPYEIAKLLDGLCGILRGRWWQRAVLGPDTLCLGLVNHPASRTLHFTITARADSAGAVADRLRATYPDVRARAIALWPAGTPGGPLQTLLGNGRVCPFGVLRIKKARRGLWSLQTSRDYAHSPIEALVATMAGSRADCQAQLAITPATSLLERLVDRRIRHEERRLRADVAYDDRDPGVQSVVAQKHLAGAAEGVGRSACYLDYRLLVPRGRRDLARQLAGVIAEARAENTLARRTMRLRRRLYVERIARGIPPLLPSLTRGLVSTAELAELWQLPTLRIKGVGLVRSGSRQIAAPPQISRQPQDRLLEDEHGPVGIAPGDRRYGHAVIGAAGGGKSALLARHIANTAQDPSRALIVLDPKEDLARTALCVVPAGRQVHYLDLGHPRIGLNPLSALAARDTAAEVIADLMVTAIRETAGETSVGARADQFLRGAITAVATVEQQPTLHHVYRMLDPDDGGYRDWVVRELAYSPETEHLRDFWGPRFTARAKANPRFLAEIMESPLNKLSRFLAVPSLAYLTSHPVPLDLPGIIDRREVLIVSGSKGAVGEENAVLVLQILIGLIQRLSHQQQRLATDARARVALVIDEAHNLLTPSFATMLSEGRSAGLEVTAAFQYTGQIQNDRVRSGIKSLLQNISIFRLRELAEARAAAGLAMEVYADNIRGDDEDSQRLRIDPVDVINLPNHRAINLWLADGEPQHAFTATTTPTELLENEPGARRRRETHLARQRAAAHHPHDHAQPIRPPLIWDINTPATADGRTVTVDLTSWHDRPNPLGRVVIELRGAAGAMGYAATPADDSGRRWSITVPEDSRRPDHLPPGIYAPIMHAGTQGASWTPTTAQATAHTEEGDGVSVYLGDATSGSI